MQNQLVPAVSWPQYGRELTPSPSPSQTAAGMSIFPKSIKLQPMTSISGPSVLCTNKYPYLNFNLDTPSRIQIKLIRGRQLIQRTSGVILKTNRSVNLAIYYVQCCFWVRKKWRVQVPCNISHLCRGSPTPLHLSVLASALKKKSPKDRPDFFDRLAQFDFSCRPTTTQPKDQASRQHKPRSQSSPLHCRCPDEPSIMANVAEKARFHLERAVPQLREFEDKEIFDKVKSRQTPASSARC